MLKKSNKFIAYLVAFAIALSSLAGISFPIVRAITADTILSAAAEYVMINQNDVTKEGLLGAIHSVAESATIDDHDFYIKHSVPGVKDNTTDYPLDIKGSNGAVAAIIDYNGKSYGFSKAFAYSTEIISISETAVVGQSNGFTYDKSGNVTAYNGTADKIVFPTGYSGGMTALADKSSVNNIEVLIYSGSAKFVSGAFSNWDGLIAVDFNSKPNTNWGFALTSGRESSMFSECDNLKYFSFPEWISNGGYYNAVFPNAFFEGCSKLENVVLPKKYSGVGQLSAGVINYGYRSFYGTAVRDFVFLQDIAVGNVNTPNSDYLSSTFGAATFKKGTRNVHFYSDNMTFMRAVALSAAAVSSADYNVSDDNLVKLASSAIAGSSDAESFAKSLTYEYESAQTDFATLRQVVISKGNDSVTVELVVPKTLKNLNVEGYSIAPSFDSTTLDYSLTVPYTVSDININAEVVEGAFIESVIGDKNLEVGKNTVTVSVKNIDGKTVTYNIEVTRNDPPDETYQKINEVAGAYVTNKRNAVTYEGLIAAVREVLPAVTLDKENDFYIKHAVNGVKDNTTDYPLNIAGSDGAVAAIFENNGKRYGFTCAFAHEVELIEIKETAVVGKSAGIKYDEAGNVIGYSGNADKIVFPEGYAGGVVNIEDKSEFNNFKVLVYSSSIKFPSGAFSNWDGLIAVDFNSKPNTNWGFAMTASREASIFASCDELKYFSFPEWTSNAGYYNSVFPNSMFENCNKLETVVLPKKISGVGQLQSGAVFYGSKSFYGTAVREIVFPAISVGDVATPNADYESNTFGSPKISGGTRNIHFNFEKMTFVRAVALAAASMNELGADSTSDKAIEIARKAITGTSDASAFADSLDFVVESEWVKNDYVAQGVITVSDGEDIIPINFNASQTLRMLDVGYSLKPAFSPSVTKYTVETSSRDSDIKVSAVTANGAEIISISGNTGLVEGVPQDITVVVLSAEKKTFTYTITATRQGATPLDDALEQKLSDYAEQFSGDNYTTESEYLLYLSSYDADIDITVSASDFYKYNSIPGAKEINDILVPGRAGYLAAIVEVSNGVETKKIAVKSAIEPFMKNYTFTEDEISKEEDFVLSEDGSTLEYYKGDAKKVVIPDGVLYIESGWYSGEKVEEVQVLIVPDSVIELPASFCYGMMRLEACYLGNTITELPSSVFSRCYSLQYLHLPEEVALIGYACFQFALTLPELYFPSTIESINARAFWTCGVRNYNLPANIMSLADVAICYPQFSGGIWNEPDAYSDEFKNQLADIMNGYQFNKNNVIVNYFGTSLNMESAASIATSSYQAMGAQLHVNVPTALESTIFKDKQHDWAIYHFYTDMSMSESIARMQFALDNELFFGIATADDVIKVLNNSAYSTKEITYTWIEPFKNDGETVSGTLAVSDGEVSGTVVLNRDIYTPPPVPKLPALKGDKTDSRLEIFLDDEESDDSSADVVPEVSFDDYDDEEKVEIETDENKKAFVEIRIRKAKKDALSKAVLEKLSKYPYIAFDLSLYSERELKMSGKLGVAIPIPKDLDGKRCSVYYVTDDGKFINMKAKKSGNNMVFYTTKLDTYVLVQDIVDYTPVIVAACCGGGVLLIAAALVFVLLIRRKRRAK